MASPKMSGTAGPTGFIGAKAAASEAKTPPARCRRRLPWRMGDGGRWLLIVASAGAGLYGDDGFGEEAGGDDLGGDFAADFGGIDGWEYFNSLPGGTSAPWQWAQQIAPVVKG